MLDRRKSRVLELNQKHQEMARKRVSARYCIQLICDSLILECTRHEFDEG